MPTHRRLWLQGIGNGLPLAAVVTTPEIAEVLAHRIHFNTFGGNPVSSAAGRAVLQAIDEDDLQANCAKVKIARALLQLASHAESDNGFMHPPMGSNHEWKGCMLLVSSNRQTNDKLLWCCCQTAVQEETQGEGCGFKTHSGNAQPQS